MASNSQFDGEDRRRHGAWASLRRGALRHSARVNKSEKMRIDLDRDLVMGTLLVLLLLLGCVVGVTLYQQQQIRNNQESIQHQQRAQSKQQHELARLEKRDRINSYQTAYRFCSRINNDRAAVHWLIKTGTRPDKKSRMRALEKKSGIPILNCAPNITGDPATYMSPSRQRRFVQRWSSGHLTPAEIGICRVKIGTLDPPGICNP